MLSLHMCNYIPKEQQMTKDSPTIEALTGKTVTIEVNDHKVEMPAGPATGLEIKNAAIKQGVNIQPNLCCRLNCPTDPARSSATTTRSP